MNDPHSSFFVLIYQGKCTKEKICFFFSVYLFVNIAGMWYDGSAQLISFVSWNCRSNQQVENKPYHVPHVLMQL